MMRGGYLLVDAMIAVIIAGIVAAVFVTINYYTQLQANLLKRQNSTLILDVIRSRLLHEAADVDSDSYFELLKEDNTSTLPVQVGTGTDAWGRRINYTTIDLGIPNAVDGNYSDSNLSISPNSNILGRLVSLGENGTLETTSAHSSAQGDDIMVEIGLGEMNHFKLYGGSEISTQTRGYNSAIVSAVAPATPIDGTLWFDTGAGVLKIYYDSNSSWGTL